MLASSRSKKQLLALTLPSLVPVMVPVVVSLIQIPSLSSLRRISKRKTAAKPKRAENRPLRVDRRQGLYRKGNDHAPQEAPQRRAERDREGGRQEHQPDPPGGRADHRPHQGLENPPAPTTGAPCTHSSRPSPPPQPADQDKKYDIGPPDALEILELINYARSKENLKPLKMYEPLNRTAQWMANDMKENNYFSHYKPGTTIPHGLLKARAVCNAPAENLVQGGGILCNNFVVKIGSG